MLSEESSSKKREYEDKILEFMKQTQHSSNTHQSEPRAGQSNKRQKPNQSKHTQQSLWSDPSKTLLKDSSKSSLKRQDHPKNHNYNHTKSLNRKSIPVSQTQEQQEVPFSQRHKQLLSKIDSRISEMNKKISEQISNEENALLNEYAEKLKSKQDELNKLRLVTNQEMINEKTIERKEQLKREKDNLIEGNHYHSQKLEELKREFSRLTETREFERKSLAVLMLDQPTQVHEFSKISSHTLQSIHKFKNKSKPVYFSSQDYVQKVLNKYNQTSQIINESLTESRFKKSQKNPRSQSYIHAQSHSKYSFLPKILQKNKSLTNSNSTVNPENEMQFYSYRKMKKKFDRAKSTGVFDNNFQGSLAIEGDQRDIKSFDTNKTDEKLKKVFRYNNSNRLESKTNGSSEMITSSQMNQNSKQKISNTSEIAIPRKEGTDKFQYTKEYLEQFVVKKTVKEHIDRKSIGQKKEKSVQSLKEMEKIINEKEKTISEKLEPPLKIQTLFRTAVDNYYRFKHQKEKQKQKKPKQQNSLSQSSINQQNQNQDALNNQTSQQKDKKRVQSLVEIKQFDKKIIMDVLLNHYDFKRYFYELIVSEFDLGTARKAELNFENLIRNFDSSKGISSGKD